jgi:putative endopeptidase
MTPPTVNAYYSPNNNEIVVPAGILQGLYFNALYHPTINYGGTGVTMGHEQTHGFDDQGSQYNGDGSFENW